MAVIPVPHGPIPGLVFLFLYMFRILFLVLLPNTRAELEDLHPQQSRGARIRSKVQWAEEGETSTSYFLCLEKRNGERRLFSAIRSMCGVIVSSLVDISCAWVSFYDHHLLLNLSIFHNKTFLDQISQNLTGLFSGIIM